MSLKGSATLERARLLVSSIAGRPTDSLQSVRALGRSVGMSPATVQRALKSVGVTFRDVVRIVRLAQAAELLRSEPAIKVEALSRSVGWRSRRSLYQAVRRSSGLSLADWKQEVLFHRRCRAEVVASFPEGS